MLKENEWNTINNILLELYTIEDIETLSKKVINVLRMLIPFSKGYFILLNENQKIDIAKSYFYEMDNSIRDKYINTFFDKDYLQYLYDFSKETTVFQDSLMLADEVRKNTEFYENFLLPADIPFGSGILLVKNQKLIGIFNLFRTTSLGDFTEKDIYILNILKNHLENMIYKTTQFSVKQGIVEKCFETAEKKFELSERENEILKLIADGKSNSEISDTLCVSLSTVKKHVYNIFNKAGVNSRTQLLNSIYTQ